jgi:hypothetical protein
MELLMGAYTLGKWASLGGLDDVAYVESDDIEILEVPEIPENPSPAAARGNIQTVHALGLPGRPLVEQVTAFVPGEALGFHVLSIAFLGKASPQADFILTLTILALVTSLVWLAWRNNTPKPSSKANLFKAIGFALISALAYMAALPDSFAHDWSVYTPTIGGLVIIALTILLPQLAALVNLPGSSLN